MNRSKAAVAAAICAVSAAKTFAATPLASVTTLSGGTAHVCAIGSGSTAHCWGANSTGALGRTTSEHFAASVDGLGPAAAVAAGFAHSCAITQGATAKCWGANWAGQLGTGVIAGTHHLPGNVVGLATGTIAIDAGTSHSCAIATGGAAKCWGGNDHGQLGNNSQAQASTPVSVVGIGAGATAITAGANHSCALVAGAAKCWGLNQFGQLGDGSNILRTVPVQVAGLGGGVTRLAAGSDHTCVLVSGAMKCWGINYHGQLGDGSTTDRNVPVDVVGLAGPVSAIAAGAGHTCAVSGGKLFCWGSNHVGQRGEGSFLSVSTPVEITGLGGPVVDVALGESYTCALLAAGTVQCLGYNLSGQLGFGSLPHRFTPVDGASGAGPLIALAVGERHSCGVNAAGKAKCWGNNADGQLGDGAQFSRTYAADVPLDGWSQVSVSADHSCGRNAAGEAYCWGRGDFGQLGVGGPLPVVRHQPSRVLGLSGVTAVSAGGGYSCAVANGAAKCWGINYSGQLGDGTTQQRASAVDVQGLASTVQDIAAGFDHTCAMRTNGGIKCWGANTFGELGDGSAAASLVPVDVVGLSSGAVALAGGGGHTCAIASGGAVRCWGKNESYQLGDGTNETRRVPVPVAGLAGPATAVAAGWSHTCALLANGDVHCWGLNSAGQLGHVPTGFPPSSSMPVAVALPASAVAIAAGAESTCALLASGATKCWGASGAGQLGNGDGVQSPRPRTVMAGDFVSAVAVTSSANPSSFGHDVTLSATVSGGEYPASGYVSVTRDGREICSIYVGFGVGSCTVSLTRGTHPLVASYGGDLYHYPSAGSLAQVVVAPAGQNCAGFDDVLSENPLCPSVEWVRNRLVTLGCTAFEFCASQAVGRLAMAAFMDRLGGVLSPEVAAKSESFVSVSLGGYSLCLSDAIAAADYPRRVHVDAVLSGKAQLSMDVGMRVSNYYFNLLGPEVRSTFVEGRYTTVRVFGAFDLDAGAQMQVALIANPLSALGPSQLDDAKCMLRTTVVNRETTYAPYDVQ